MSKTFFVYTTLNVCYSTFGRRFSSIPVRSTHVGFVFVSCICTIDLKISLSTSTRRSVYVIRPPHCHICDTVIVHTAAGYHTHTHYTVENCISQMTASVILTHTVGRSSVWSSKRFAVGRNRRVPQVLYYPPYIINSLNAQHWMLGHTFNAGVLRGAYSQTCTVNDCLYRCCA